MFVAPGRAPTFGYTLTRDAAAQVARNWWVLLLNGALLIVAGVLIAGITWTVRDLATFLGAVFVLQGLMEALTTGIDARVRRVNVVTGLLSIAAGIAIIAWPNPGVLAIAIFLGAWLIIMGTIAISGAFAARRIFSDWWLLLVLGMLEVPLGLLALVAPGPALAGLITIGAVFAVLIGAVRIVLAFEVKRLPEDVDEVFAASQHNGAAESLAPAHPKVAANS
jgi:uncharacterized membrane protein HdeD (DUF308 family)